MFIIDVFVVAILNHSSRCISIHRDNKRKERENKTTQLLGARKKVDNAKNIINLNQTKMTMIYYHPPQLLKKGLKILIAKCIFFILQNKSAKVLKTSFLQFR
jgi:hypothetical protein